MFSQVRLEERRLTVTGLVSVERINNFGNRSRLITSVHRAEWSSEAWCLFDSIRKKQLFVIKLNVLCGF